MPVETRSIRASGAVGRFPSVTRGFDDDAEEEQPEEGDAQTENACRRWLRKVCPCCCPKPKDDDITDTLVTGIDELEKEDEVDNEKSVTGDSELDELLLKVRAIDLMKSKSGVIRTEHHTNLYQSNNFIIRRGQTFQMWITLSRPFDSSTDKLHLELKTGPLPTVSKGTHVIIPLVEGLEDGRWEAAIVEQDNKRIKLSVNSPPTAVIGRYQLTVETTNSQGQAISTHDPANDIYMLFNPWCEDDTVFMDSEQERQEYVLNQDGHIYYGTENQIGMRTWNYGHFDDGILAACLYVLEKSETPPSGWGDPVNVVRIISAMINSPDDRGVVEGNWSGNYNGGTSPTMWSGSVEILKEYQTNSGTPVKFGQCWVFAGVFTTVLRCLGIPSRTVTNFSSAHDTDVSLTTDVYLDENLDPLAHLNADSIWNFHVWTDCWMARADLPPGNGGWQAVDATPQETSQGTFRCGPASLTAVRNGTEAERIAVESACRYGSKALAYSSPTAEDVSVEVTMDGEGPEMGGDAELTITLRNSSSEKRTILLHGQVAVMYYTGVHKATIRKDVVEIDVLPNEVNVLEWSLEYKDYKDQLIDQAALMLTLSGRVKETQQVLATQFSFRLRTPNLIIKPVGKAVVGEKMAVTISFTNPLPQVLKAVIFHLEGQGLLAARKVIYGDIGSHASVSLTEHFAPTLPGPRKLLASLDCRQLTQVHGVTDITVEENSNAAL